MLYRISVAERGLTDIANIFRSRLSGLDDLLQAGTVPLIRGARRGSRGGGGARSGAHPWDGGTRAEGAGFFVSRAERRDTGVP